jgi:hypothetical protein
LQIGKSEGAGAFAGCEKTQSESGFVTGHDFSRAANVTTQMWALAPEGWFPGALDFFPPAVKPGKMITGN